MQKKNNFQIISNRQARSDNFNVEDSESEIEDIVDPLQQDNEVPDQQVPNDDDVDEFQNNKINLDLVIKELDENPPKRIFESLKAVLGKKIRNDKVLYLVEKQSDIKQWKESKELFEGGYGNEIQEYEKFLKERIQVAFMKIFNEEVGEQQCYYVHRHTIKSNNKIESCKLAIKGHDYSQKYEQFDLRFEKRFMNRKRNNTLSENTVSNHKTSNNSGSPKNKINSRRVHNVKMASNNHRRVNEQNPYIRRSNRARRNIESSSEEVMPKQTQKKEHGRIAEIVVQSHEIDLEGQVTFVVKFELGDKVMKVDDLQEKYPKELALYLYELINNQ